MPGLSPILEEAERINQAAVEEVFGRKPARAATAMLGADSAEVSVEFHGTLTSPFASPVSSPVLPSPQPTAMLQPADAAAAFEVVLPHPAAAFEVALPQHSSAEEVPHQHSSTEEVLHHHSAEAATTDCGSDQACCHDHACYHDQACSGGQSPSRPP